MQIARHSFLGGGVVLCGMGRVRMGRLSVSVSMVGWMVFEKAVRLVLNLHKIF